MFKYLKTIGAHTCAPEPEHIRVKTATVIKSGALCEMVDGYISSSYTEGKSKFIALEEKAAGVYKRSIKCIRVLPGMLFEVAFIGEVNNIPAGSLVMPICSDYDNYLHCEEGTSGIEVVNTDSYETTGTITVTIHR